MGPRSEGYRPYWREQKGVAGVPNYYAFSASGWRILSLNSEAPHGTGSTQLRWLRRELGPGNCRIAFVHKPRWSAGPRGNEPQMAPIWNALRGKARLFLSGHDHNSQRFRRQGGLIQLIAGGGGTARRYPVDETRAGLIWSNENDLAALRVRLRPGLARFAFVGAEGDVLSRGRVGCSRP